MKQAISKTRHDGWTAARRAGFLGALRVTGSVAEACAWVGKSVAGAYRLAQREPDFAAAWKTASTARDTDRTPAPAFEALDNAALMHRLKSFDAARNALPRGIIAQQKSRRA